VIVPARSRVLRSAPFKKDIGAGEPLLIVHMNHGGPSHSLTRLEVPITTKNNVYNVYSQDIVATRSITPLVYVKSTPCDQERIDVLEGRRDSVSETCAASARTGGHSGHSRRRQSTTSSRNRHSRTRSGDMDFRL
jgi:hypothetical protein